MKLEKMGIGGIELDWFRSYLSDRMQFVDINGKYSTKKKIKTCNLQGSILGPILFLIYINDLYLVSKTLTLMFADDTFALKSGPDLRNLINDLNSDINRMAIWFKANKLAVNKNKTKYMIFHVKGKKIENPPDVIYNENEPGCPFNENNVTVLERYHSLHANKDARSYKLLGVHLDENLSFNFHVKYIQNKLNKSLYCIRAAKKNLNYREWGVSPWKKLLIDV